MNIYTNKITHFATNPIHYGPLSEADATEMKGELFVVSYGSQAQGEAVTWYWIIDTASKTIVKSQFEAFGSFAARAVYDMLCVLLRTKTIEAIGDIQYSALERFLRDNPAHDALPESDRYLITFALDSLRHAVGTYTHAQAPQTTLVCHCAQVSLESIREAIELHDLRSVEEITDYTKAGAFCGSCVSPGNGPHTRTYYLDAILDETREAIRQKTDAARKELDDTPFEQLETPRKIAYVNRIIDEKIRQFLVMDGGDMEILDIKTNGEHTDIYIRYLGACNGCASASTGTLFAIENTLKEALGPKVRVLPI